MITRDLWKLSRPDAPLAASYGPKAKVEEWLHRLTAPGDRHVIEPVPCCACCGADFADVRERNGSITVWPNGAVRCDRHHDRNPCAIEGCTRTCAGTEMRSDLWLCGEHWRRFVPPRSARRRAYLALRRKGFRLGWPDEMKAEFWKLWFALVRQARRKAEGGFLDMAHLERLFG